MSAVRGIITGVVGLSLLEMVVSNQDAAGRVGGLFTTVAAILTHWLDPTVPLIPDLSGTTSTTHTEADIAQTSTAKYSPAQPQPALS